MTGCRLLVTGTVQGVGFRWFARGLASSLGLRGHAVNLPDGRVEVVAAGPAEAIDQLASGLTAGPPGARVESVSREAMDPGAVPEGFRTGAR